MLFGLLLHLTKMSRHIIRLFRGGWRGFLKFVIIIIICMSDAPGIRVCVCLCVWGGLSVRVAIFGGYTVDTGA